MRIMTLEYLEELQDELRETMQETLPVQQHELEPLQEEIYRIRMALGKTVQVENAK